MRAFLACFFSRLYCLPSTAITSAAETGSAGSTEKSYQLNPRDVFLDDLPAVGFPPHLLVT